MKKREDTIDRLVKNASDNYTEAAPPDAWMRINNRFNQRMARKRSLIIRRITTYAAIIIAFVAGYYFALMNSNNEYVQQARTSLVSFYHDLPARQNITTPENKSATPQTGISLTQNNSVAAYTPMHQGVAYPTINTKQIATLTRPFVDVHLQERIHSLAPQKGASIEYRQNVAGSVAIPDLPIPEEAKNNKKTMQRWSVTGGAGLMIAYQNPGLAEIYNPSLTSFDRSASSSTPLPSYSGGMSVNYNLSKHVSLGSGLFFNRTGQLLSNGQQLLYSATEHNSFPTNFGDIKVKNTDLLNQKPSFQSTFSAESLEQVFSYVEIPLVARYKLLDKRISLYLEAGFSNNFLIDNRVYAVDKNDKMLAGYTEDIQPHYLGGISGINLQYRINKSLHISINPILRHALESSASKQVEAIYPLSLSVYSGLVVQL